MVLVCAECRCAPAECNNDSQIITQCKNCIKPVCCCIDFHQDLSDNTGRSSNHVTYYSRFSSIVTFLRYAKGIYAAALGIEILCIAAAEIGENTSLYLFGFNPLGIAIAYSLGYALAGFTTFITILGRYDYGSPNQTICSCCSILEQDSQLQITTNPRPSQLPGQLVCSRDLHSLLKKSKVIASVIIWFLLCYFSVVY